MSWNKYELVRNASCSEAGRNLGGLVGQLERRFDNAISWFRAPCLLTTSGQSAYLLKRLMS